MKRLTPLTISDIENGVRLTFEHGVTTLLTLDGRTCDCPTGRRGAMCSHIEDGHDAYTRRKWQLAEENRKYWSPTMYEKLGFSSLIFYPPGVNWSKYHGEDYVYLQVQGGQLFVFADGAFLWLSPSHPQGGTKCSACGTRTCRHIVEAKEELAEIYELALAAAAT